MSYDTSHTFFWTFLTFFRLFTGSEYVVFGHPPPRGTTADPRVQVLLLTIAKNTSTCTTQCFLAQWVEHLRPNPKENMVYGTLCQSWLWPHLMSIRQSRLQHIYHDNPMPESSTVYLNLMPELTLSPSQGLGERVTVKYFWHVTKLTTAPQAALLNIMEDETYSKQRSCK